MNSNTKEHSNSIFILFALLFTITCIMFMYISNSFCKDLPMDVATEYKPAPLPTIIIDAGHGGEDGGTVGVNGILEKDVNLQISNILKDLFAVSGQNVVMTRKNDTMLYDKNVDYKGRKKALDLAARVKIANSYDNAIFVSIHMNAFPIEKYSGLQVYYSSQNDSSFILANEIQSTIKENLQNNNDRQVKAAGEDIFVLDRTKIPAVLIECGFLSNNKECIKLSDTEYQKKLALTIFLAISKYIDQTLD